LQSILNTFLMKRILYIFCFESIVILALSSCCNSSSLENANWNDSVIIDELRQINASISNDMLVFPLKANFFSEWQEQSEKYGSLHKNAVIDSLYQIVFLHYYYPDTNKYTYFVLPMSVEINIYNRNFNDTTGRYSLSDLKYKLMLASKGNYIPHLDTHKPVLYLFDNKYKTLSEYLGGISSDVGDDIIYDNVHDLEQHIEVNYGHWGGYWHFESMPIIEALCIFNNGVLVFLRDTWNSGIDVFIPYGTNEFIEVSNWIE